MTKQELKDLMFKDGRISLHASAEQAILTECSEAGIQVQYASERSLSYIPATNILGVIVTDEQCRVFLANSRVIKFSPATEYAKSKLRAFMPKGVADD